MKRLLYLLTLIIIFTPFRLLACINEYEVMTRPDGSTVELSSDEGGTTTDLFIHGFDTIAFLQRNSLPLR